MRCLLLGIGRQTSLLDSNIVVLVWLVVATASSCVGLVRLHHRLCLLHLRLQGRLLLELDCVGLWLLLMVCRNLLGHIHGL